MGTIQPLGGPDNGHKGAALSLLVDAMATLLAGEDPDDEERIGNNVTLLAIKTDPPSRPARRVMPHMSVSAAPPIPVGRFCSRAIGSGRRGVTDDGRDRRASRSARSARPRSRSVWASRSRCDRREEGP